MTSLAEQYRAERRQFSASMIYNPRPTTAPGPSVYVDSQYTGLSGYQGGSADKLAKRPGESTESWRRRVQAVGRHLPEDDLAARLAEIDAADQVQTHEQLRDQLDARQSGVDRGIMGSMSPQDRAAMMNRAMVPGNSMSDSSAGMNGGIGDSIGPAPARVWLSQIEQRPAFAQRTDVSGLRSSGAADGWIGADR